MKRTRLAFNWYAPSRLCFPQQQRRWACCAQRATERRASISASDLLLTKVGTPSGVDGSQLSQLRTLGDILLSANETTNLTAVRTHDGFIARHVVDAIGLLPLLDKVAPQRLIDVGTGAGFPGLVLAICRPVWQLTLVESVRKKTRFHEQAIRELGLRNVETVWARAEEVGQDMRYREMYDVACARAVARMPILAELTLPFVRQGGILVAQKSIEVEGPLLELDAAKGALKQLGAVLDRVEYSWTCDLVRQFMPSEDDKDTSRRRASIVVRKVAQTNRKYPRAPGTPKKNPL